jgi:tetratricopeptide (TPR) repeat protein
LSGRAAAVLVCGGLALGLAPVAPLAEDEPGRAKPPALDSGLTAAIRAVKAGRYAEAQSAVDAYLRTATPAHPGQAHFVAGLGYHEQKLYERACERFARAAELEPGYFTTYFFQGFALFNAGRLPEARKAFETYLAADPGEAEAHFGLGLVALEDDRADDAERSFRRAIERAGGGAAPGSLAPKARRDLARYETRLADVFLRRDDTPRARIALERAVSLWPEFFEPWHKLALVLRRLGDTAGAEKAESRSAEARRLRQAGRTP